MRKLALTTLATLLLASCQSVADQPVTAKLPTNYRTVAAAFIKDQLKDPYSIRDAIITTRPVMLSGILIGSNKPGVCVQFNAKNGFGAYMGVKNYTVPFNNGKPIALHNGVCPDENWVTFTELMR